MEVLSMLSYVVVIGMDEQTRVVRWIFEAFWPDAMCQRWSGVINRL